MLLTILILYISGIHHFAWCKPFFMDEMEELSDLEAGIHYDKTVTKEIDEKLDQKLFYKMIEKQHNIVDDIITANEEHNDELFDMDIKLPLNTPSHRPRRDLASYKTQLWPGGIIPYVINETFTSHPYHLPEIHKAIDEYNERTKCVRLVERTNEINYISFHYLHGCYSGLGYHANQGEHIISIGNGCASKGIVLHEIKHALGFHHTHARMDRDNYITVQWENIISGKQQWFYLENEYHTNYGAYDKYSVMHYSQLAFAKDIRNPSLISKSNPGEALGQRRELSDLDILQLDHFYCQENIKTTTTVTTTPTTTTPTTKTTTTPTTTTTTTPTTTTTTHKTTTTTRPTTTTTRPTSTTTTTTTTLTPKSTTATSTTASTKTTTTTTTPTTTPTTTTSTTKTQPTTTTSTTKTVKNIESHGVGCEEMIDVYVTKQCQQMAYICQVPSLFINMNIYCAYTCCKTLLT